MCPSLLFSDGYALCREAMSGDKWGRRSEVVEWGDIGFPPHLLHLELVCSRTEASNDFELTRLSMCAVQVAACGCIMHAMEGAV